METGLYYNRFRYYNPEDGQYVSQDPIGLMGGMASYAYCLDPIKQVDVFGLSSCPGTSRNPWNDFQTRSKGQFKNSRESAEAWRKFQRGEFDSMADMLDLSSQKNKAVFWSGDWNKAQQYATKIGGATMEATPGGSIFNNWDYLNKKFDKNMWGKGGPQDARPLWVSLSEKYVKSSSGNVHYVHPKGYEGGIWKDVEKPTLENLGTNIIDLPF